VLQKRKKNKNRGSTLIEILVVAFILTVSLVALVSLITMSVARTRLAKERSVATRLAQEGMDWIMAERNRVGMGGMSLTAGLTYCLNIFPSQTTELASECSPNDTMLDLYQRELVVDSVLDDAINYRVIVSWGENRQVEMSGAVTKWQK